MLISSENNTVYCRPAHVHVGCTTCQYEGHEDTRYHGETQ